MPTAEGGASCPARAAAHDHALPAHGDVPAPRQRPASCQASWGWTLQAGLEPASAAGRAWSGPVWVGRGPRSSRGRGWMESHEAVRSGEGRKGAAVSGPRRQGAQALVQTGRRQGWGTKSRGKPQPPAQPPAQPPTQPPAQPPAQGRASGPHAGVREAAGSLSGVCKRPQPPGVCRAGPVLTLVVSGSDR